MEYEPITAAHITQLVPFHMRCLGGILVRLGPFWMRRFYEAGLKEGSGAFGFAALQNNEIVGFSFGSVKGTSFLGGLFPRPCNELHYIAVRPDLRRQKIGETLIQMFRDELQRRQAVFELSVPRDNVAANTFYVKNGGEILADDEEMRRYRF